MIETTLDLSSTIIHTTKHYRLTRHGDASSYSYRIVGLRDEHAPSLYPPIVDVRMAWDEEDGWCADININVDDPPARYMDLATFGRWVRWMTGIDNELEEIGRKAEQDMAEQTRKERR